MATKAQLEAEVAALREGMARLRSYLTSSKFFEETTVQTRDVLLRLREVDQAATEAREARPEQVAP